LRKELLALAGVAGAGAVLWYLTRRPTPSPAGGLAIETEVLGATVTITITARATAGTPPINVDLDITAKDKYTGEPVLTRSKTLVITDLTVPETYMVQFTGEPGRTYTVWVTATFRNEWGEYPTSASRDVTVPGEAPKGEISVEVTVT